MIVPTYDPKQWYNQLEKMSKLFGPQDPDILVRQMLPRRETLPG